MYLQTGDMGGEIVGEDHPKARTTRSTNKTDVQIQPNRMKDLWGRRKSIDYSTISYWQKVSHCTIL